MDDSADAGGPLQAFTTPISSKFADELQLLSREDLTDAPEVTQAQATINGVLGKGPRKARAQRRGLLGVSEATFDRMVARGDFPKPIRIGPRLVRWPATIVHEWIAVACRK
jgi:predicted DNA-binding transcriptional regulator AlpA